MSDSTSGTFTVDLGAGWELTARSEDRTERQQAMGTVPQTFKVLAFVVGDGVSSYPVDAAQAQVLLAMRGNLRLP